MLRLAMRDGLNSLQNFSADDILGALGLQQRRAVSDAIIPSVALFAAGALVGAAAAVLLTPKTGQQLRRELTDGARDLSQKLTSTAQEYTGAVRSSAQGSNASHA
jgi:hypothetical protein